MRFVKAWCNFQCTLQADRRKRVQAAVTSIEGLMEVFRAKEVWEHSTQWYRQVRDKQSHPTREGLDQDSSERA